MITLNKTLVAATAALITMSGTAYAQSFDAETARLDLSLDTNGDGMVDDDELIAGNMDVFDTDGDGSIDAEERGVADSMLDVGTTIQGNAESMAPGTDSEFMFDAEAARLDLALDTNGDGSVDDEELIMGNMDLFDTDGNGSIDADERGIAEETLMSGSMATSASTVAVEPATIQDFDADRARLDLSLDTNNDGMVDDDELINGNMELFDTDGNGSIDADERGAAEQSIL